MKSKKMFNNSKIEYVYLFKKKQNICFIISYYIENTKINIW